MRCPGVTPTRAPIVQKWSASRGETLLLEAFRCLSSANITAQMTLCKCWFEIERSINDDVYSILALLQPREVCIHTRVRFPLCPFIHLIAVGTVQVLGWCFLRAF